MLFNLQVSSFKSIINFFTCLDLHICKLLIKINFFFQRYSNDIRHDKREQEEFLKARRMQLSIIHR